MLRVHTINDKIAQNVRLDAIAMVVVDSYILTGCTDIAHETKKFNEIAL